MKTKALKLKKQISSYFHIRKYVFVYAFYVCITIHIYCLYVKEKWVSGILVFVKAQMYDFGDYLDKAVLLDLTIYVYISDYTYVYKRCSNVMS